MKSAFIFPLALTLLAANCKNKSKAEYKQATDTAAAVSDNPAQNYSTYCSGCHGREAEMFAGNDWKHGRSKEDLFKGIKYGYPNEGMPAFAETFTDKQTEELSAYIIESMQNGAHQDYDSKSTGTVYTTDKLKFTLDTIATGIDVPWGMAFLPNGDMLVTERGGTLYRVSNGEKQKITGVPQVVAEGQGGLLDVVLHPNFINNSLIYLSYSKRHPENSRLATTAVMRAKLSGNNLIDPKDIFVAQPYQTTRHHYGSRLVFDRDGYLFVSVGERGREKENPQDIEDNQLGKIHRINDDGSIPADNPFKDDKGKSTTLYTYGNRNPQGMALHPETGVLWENEHGPRGGDEINIIKAGKNYGWPLVTYGINYNGTTITDKTTAPGIEAPIHQWTPSIGPSGMAFVTGKNYIHWNGAILTGSLPFEYLNLSFLKGNKVVREEKLLEGIGRVRDVRMAPDGYVYIAVEEPAAAIFRLRPVK